IWIVQVPADVRVPTFGGGGGVGVETPQLAHLARIVRRGGTQGHEAVRFRRLLRAPNGPAAAESFFALDLRRPLGLNGRILLVTAWPARSNARHIYQLAMVRYGRQRSPKASSCLGVGMCFLP